MKIQMLKNKNTFAIAMFLMLATTATIVNLPTVYADLATFAFMSAVPNPIGVGQSVMIQMWLSATPPTATPLGGDRWEGYTLEITKPDGTKETKGPYKSDSVGFAWLKYVPTTTGNYSLKFTFPGQNLTGGVNPNPAGVPYIGTYYKPSTSQPVKLVVQQDPVQEWPISALPTDYWEHPIYAENREWYSIGGNWLMSGYNVSTNTGSRFNPYTTAPNTGHIVWTKELAFGGIVGGEFNTKTYYFGSSYERKFSPPVIIDGHLYYNIPLSNSPSGGGFCCVDLHTGEQLWLQNAGSINFGQLLDFESGSQHGVIPYLWGIVGTTYKMYDAVTGNWILDLENATAGITSVVTFSAKGDVLVYFTPSNNKWLAMWNSTKAIVNPPERFDWRPPAGGKIDWKNGIQWNTTIPAGTVSGAGFGLSGFGPAQLLTSDLLIVNSYVSVSPPIIQHLAFSAVNGQLLWTKNHTDTWAQPQYSGLNFGGIADGVYIYFYRDLMQYVGYNAYTGDKLWETDPINVSWGQMGYVIYDSAEAYGKFFIPSYDGYIRCYDTQTGENLWTYYCGNSGFETSYGSWAIGPHRGLQIADGKVYAINAEHSVDSPPWRGARLHCIDAETGKGLWNVSGWYEAGENCPIVGGYLVGLNGYDNYIYCFGKGGTATTVTASPKVSVLGNTVLLEGMVTDQSPGTTQHALTVRYPNGVPAIADKEMTEWMEYLYMQKPRPTNATGVEVTVSVLDANNNFREIGKTTSNSEGFYSLVWTPDIPGKYTVIASFDGSESYYSSHADTAFVVDPAPPAPAAPEPAPPSMTDTYVISGVAAIIVAVAIVGVVIVLLFRKRP
jgi:hypothetical protein